ncbi:hypothetical protein CYL18_04250 [Pradoshia eiseniae]|uniref:Uncharacterized protein n=1 Tax=Pradoshia eiseniae TaxID=2064768 RepID=A0A2S7N527_9BACI|nr:hypothetical protein [Pradoshia eiseniae]PQD97093.1 hypothetical protein CYL18_04250 [Pradoshia eiseniae]
MRREIKLTVKSILIITVFIIIATILLVYATIMLIDYSRKADDTASAVISLIGNITGGIIGGIVAYIVAAFQVKSTIEYDGYKSVSTSYSLLRMVKSELNNNKKIISKFHEDFVNGEKTSHLDSITSSYWSMSIDKLGPEVDEKTIETLQECHLMLEAYKKQPEKISIKASEDIIIKISNAIKLLEDNIKSIKPIK